MSLEHCAELLAAHDPDRLGATLVAEPADRPALLTLYALNLELARAPFQSREPMLAEMRLQWWIERLAEMGAGREPPLHDVLTPLWQEWGPSAGALVSLAEARRRDCEREPFHEEGEVLVYIRATAGGLMWQAAHRLGVDMSARPVVEAQAMGAGIAAWLRALPQLQPLGLGLAAPSSETTAALARRGLAGFSDAARRRRLLPKRAVAALYPGPRAARLLRQVARGEIDPLAQVIEISAFDRRASLAGLALTGRWWR